MKPRTSSPIVRELLETGRITSFPVIDAHGHMGTWPAIWFPNSDAQQMIHTMDRCGVSTLVFSHHNALQDPQTGNETAQQEIDRFPDRLIGYYAVNARYPENIREITRNFSRLRGFAGYKILAAYNKTPITLPEYAPLWAHAHEEKRPVLLHTWGGDTCAGWRQVKEIAERYPDARILMGHSQYGDWDEAISLAKEFPNVFCELTAAGDVNGVVQKMVDDGIEEKMLFGTDLPWFDPMHLIGVIACSRISDAARKRILHDNAAELFSRWLSC
ncbi:MAG: amidohydrolase family protein [Phycisphaerae bacterium]|nr:amidohydrolase family protein [Phycisphaerae bacterium]